MLALRERVKPLAIDVMKAEQRGWTHAGKAPLLFTGTRIKQGGPETRQGGDKGILKRDWKGARQACGVTYVERWVQMES
jgi:hypothetical protein